MARARAEWTDEEFLILTENAGKLKTSDIAALLKKSDNAVKQMACALKISLSTTPRESLEVVAKIKELLSEGIHSAQWIAAKTGVKPNYVTSIKLGRIHKDAPPPPPTCSPTGNEKLINSIFS